MTPLRIETLKDDKTGMIFAEVMAEGAAGPVIRSEPMYETHEEATAEIVAILKRAWPSISPFDEDPTIGV